MGILDWIKGEIRVQRAGQIKRDETKRNQLAKGYQNSETEKQIQKLDARIAKNKERQKIAAENNTKANNTTKNVSYSKTTTVNNGINTNIDISKKNKSKK